MCIRDRLKACPEVHCNGADLDLCPDIFRPVGEIDGHLNVQVQDVYKRQDQIPVLDSAGIFRIMILNNVHIEGKHMNTVVTSTDEILKASRELIRERGWSATVSYTHLDVYKRQGVYRKMHAQSKTS